MALCLEMAGSQPVIKGVTGLIEAPQKLMEQKELLQNREFQFIVFENQKKLAGSFVLAGLAGMAAGFPLNRNRFLRYPAESVFWQLIRYALVNRKQKKWMEYIKLGN